jgi:hypothetical protein
MNVIVAFSITKKAVLVPKSKILFTRKGISMKLK